MTSHDAEKSSRQTFLSIVSHELKTPLTSIQGFIQALHRKIAQKRSVYSPYVLISDNDLAQYQGHLDTMLSQIKRLNKLIDDLLDVSVIETGQLSFNWSEIDLVQLLADVCGRLQMNSSKHRINLRLTNSTKLLVQGDDTRLEKLFSNLISNAIKYSPHSSVVDVSIKTLDDSYRIAITDYGVGINEDEKDKIFELYYRGRDVKRNKVSGIGLGLFLSKQIVELHKGTITFESRIGHGTTFFVELPKKQVSSPLDRPLLQSV